MEFEFFFDSYVHGFMLHDVGREIAAVHRGENGSNFLCALGLLCYTEALGKWVPGVDPSKSGASFAAFFKRLGDSYADYLASGEKPYDFYRNGMVHEYLAKGRCEIAMIDDPQKPAECGVFNDGNHYVFVVERYFQDFAVACARLYIELVGHRPHLSTCTRRTCFPMRSARKD